MLRRRTLLLAASAGAGSTQSSAGASSSSGATSSSSESESTGASGSRGTKEGAAWSISRKSQDWKFRFYGNTRTESSLGVGSARASWTTENAAPGIKDHPKESRQTEREREGMFYQARPYSSKQRSTIHWVWYLTRVSTFVFFLSASVPFIYLCYSWYVIDIEWAKQRAQGVLLLWNRRNEQVFIQYLTQRKNSLLELWGFKSWDIEGRDDAALDSIAPYYQDHMGKAGMPLPNPKPNKPPAPVAS